MRGSKNIKGNPSALCFREKTKGVHRALRGAPLETAGCFPSSLLPQGKGSDRVMPVFSDMHVCHLSPCHTPSQSTGNWKVLLPFPQAVNGVGSTACVPVS